MRFSNGFIKLERKTFTENFEGDGKLWATFTYIAMNIHWSDKPSIYSKMGKDFTVKKGEYYTTYQELGHWLGFNFRTLKQQLSRLKKRGLIDLRSHKNCMCIVFLQSECIGDYTTNEEDKNIRNEELKYISKDIYSQTSSKSKFQDSNSGSTAPDKTTFDNSEGRKNPSPTRSDGLSNAMTPDKLFRLWNEYCGPLPKCRTLSDKRKRQCKMRLRENPDEEYWKTVISNLSKSEFAVEGKWCGFDWIIKNEDNGLKAFEGNYNKSNSTNFKPEPKITNIEDLF